MTLEAINHIDQTFSVIAIIDDVENRNQDSEND